MNKKIRSTARASPMAAALSPTTRGGVERRREAGIAAPLGAPTWQALARQASPSRARASARPVLASRVVALDRWPPPRSASTRWAPPSARQAAPRSASGRRAPPRSSSDKRAAPRSASARRAPPSHTRASAWRAPATSATISFSTLLVSLQAPSGRCGQSCFGIQCRFYNGDNDDPWFGVGADMFYNDARVRGRGRGVGVSKPRRAAGGGLSQGVGVVVAGGHDTMPPPSNGRGRGKRPCPSDGGPATRDRGKAKAAYKPPRPAAAEALVDVESSQATREDEELEGSFNVNSNPDFDEANWSFENTRIFCEICIEEIRDGNRCNGTMTNRGYKNMADKYLERVGLRHSKVQLKNKLDLLKSLYSFWLQLNKDMGLGWNDVLGTVVTTEEYWERTTKRRSYCKQLKYGPPEHEELLHKMSRGVVVDGSTACAPGEVFGEGHSNGFVGAGENEDFPGGDENEETLASPVSDSVPLKRGASPSVVTSPMKRTRNPMVRVMKNIHATLETNCSIANKVMLGEHLDGIIEKMLDMTVDCGASEESVEYFIATLLFKDAVNRSTFKAIKTKNGRLAWLRRHCDKEGLAWN